MTEEKNTNPEAEARPSGLTQKEKDKIRKVKKAMISVSHVFIGQGIVFLLIGIPSLVMWYRHPESKGIYWFIGSCILSAIYLLVGIGLHKLQRWTKEISLVLSFTILVPRFSKGISRDVFAIIKKASKLGLFDKNKEEII